MNAEIEDDDIQSGDSEEQRRAGGYLVEQLATHFGIRLGPKKIEMPRGGWLEFDGFSKEPPLICEAWAHIGSPKSAQKAKIAKDAFKLLLGEKLLNTPFRKVLVFADDKAAAHFKGRSWMAKGIEAAGIEIKIIHLPPDLHDAVLRAQKRQYR